MTDWDVMPPEALYKFLGVADGQRPPWKERVQQLLSGQAYMPSPAQFNDPFDSLPHIILPETTDEYVAALPSLALRMSAALPGIPPDYIAQVLSEALPLTTPDFMNSIVRDSTVRTGREMGVFCFAECIESVLMWGHYASHHSGIALRFDFRRQQHGGLMPLFKVKYQEARPMLRDFVTGMDPEEITQALVSKAKFWEYEQEWRSVLPDGARTFVSFNPEVITGVVFGLNCHRDDEDWVRDVVRGRGIELMRVQAETRTFGLSLGPA